jgi:hypothetical protein
LKHEKVASFVAEGISQMTFAAMGEDFLKSRVGLGKLVDTHILLKEKHGRYRLMEQLMKGEFTLDVL